MQSIVHNNDDRTDPARRKISHLEIMRRFSIVGRLPRYRAPLPGRFGMRPDVRHRDPVFPPIPVAE